MFLKCAIRFPTLCLVDWEDLCFDILLCDVNFSHFSFQFFCLFDSQGEIVPIYLPNPEETRIWAQIWEGEKESLCSLQHLILQLLLTVAAFF